MSAEPAAVLENGAGREASARERILDAAVERIAMEGIDDLRIARIAIDAGVSPALVHYHFDSRETLLAEALEYSYHRVGNERIPDQGGRGVGAEERFRSMLVSYTPVPGDQHKDWMLWVELWLRAIRNPELAPISARLYADMHAWVRDAAEASRGGGEGEGLDSDAFADHLLALIDGCGVRVLLGDPGMTRDRMRMLVWSYISGELGFDPDPNRPAGGS